ncbi:nitrate- and nitrite sensing domain-containing protein [Salinispora tropica]|uniref:histidine kinase n=1 Tax=Salinispora tropica (strain ATCC BAA-916 / DSM 44818 / JCM 13857 / NBRC 105044 / CNB-440) TaxID=369723 RepID=A4XAT1_SALTO|nr:nitrate- and nitrite sensing domain-containing protein [Salinispora tropica]ABP56030.1 Nitrate and nitrite sensing domain protein [Salinispora tropica CNB-440]
MNTRDWPIRAKLTALVVAPVTALLTLWIFATTLTYGPAQSLLAARTLLNEFGRPGEAVVAELQRERRLSVVYLAAESAQVDLDSQRRQTDEAIAELRRRAAGDDLRDATSDLLDVRLDRLLVALDALPAGRGQIDRGGVDRSGVVDLYSGMVSSAFQAFAALSALPDPELHREALAVTALGHSRELLGQADAVLAGVFVSGSFAEGEHRRLVQTIVNQRFLAESAVADLPAAERSVYQQLTEQAEFRRLGQMQDLLIENTTDQPPIAAANWQADYDAVQQAMRDYELDQADGLADRSIPMAVRVFLLLASAGLLGLIAVVVSLVVAIRVGRSLASRLGRLHTVLERAERQLPELVARMRHGETVDVEREAPSVDFGTDEIGQVGRAFTAVRRTAIRSAEGEVNLRRGLNEVFLNIARRSQGLVHRQLALLDRMERRTENPDELADLFQVDHLATRLRRHAEDLVILAGSAPSRGWRNPVAMVDLIRGALSEVEAYKRVDIGGVQSAGLVGRTVGDLIHLLAELIENATRFSPPGTRVQVVGARRVDGYLFEITDQGLGMSTEALTDANSLLASSPEFDPTRTDRLGLFVVARLAARHGVRVRLRRSESAGLTAVVLVPDELVAEEPLPSGMAPGERERSGSRAVRREMPGRLPTGSEPLALANSTSVPTVGESAGTDVGPAPVEVAGEIDGLPRRVRRRPAAIPRSRVGTAVPPGGATGGPGQERLGRPEPAGAAGAGTDGVSRSPSGPGGATAEGRRLRPAVDGPTVRQPAVGGRQSPSADPTPRSPEEARRIMAALQAGTARGRRVAAARVSMSEAGPGARPIDASDGLEIPTATERDA